MRTPSKYLPLLLGCSALCLGLALAGETKVITYKNSFDGTEQQAELFVPSSYDGKKGLPLLAFSHFMGGNKSSARGVGHYEVAERVGWLVVSPELHGLNTDGKTSLGAIPAQHDVIDAIRYVQANYKVDENRIYADGRSMGGLQTLLLAAKYPHLFAAAMAGQPPTDFSIWEREGPRLSEIVVKEFGGTRAERPFEYARREPLTYAKNLRYTPTMIWNGTLDRVVTPEHAKKMIALMQRYNPYQQGVFWLEGAGHNPINYGAEWICEKLRWYELTRYRFYPDLDFILDESGQFSWLALEQKEEGKFSEVTTTLAEEVLTVRCKNVGRLKVDLAPFRGRVPRSIAIEPDGPLELQVVGGKGGPLVKSVSGKQVVDLE